MFARVIAKLAIEMLMQVVQATDNYSNSKDKQLAISEIKLVYLIKV